jgi:hypothetical protein
MNGYLSGFRQGQIAWTDDDEEAVATVAVIVQAVPHGTDNFVLLKYTVTDNYTGERSDEDYRIQLTTTSCHYGGCRWWFRCPLYSAGSYCGQRVRKIYLPPGGDYFGCRHCYNLTYQCQKEHDKRVDAILKDPALFTSMLDSKNNKEFLLAMRAWIRTL